MSWRATGGLSDGTYLFGPLEITDKRELGHSLVISVDGVESRIVYDSKIEREFSPELLKEMEVWVREYRIWKAEKPGRHTRWYTFPEHIKRNSL